jgi:hypothetical protein
MLLWKSGLSLTSDDCAPGVAQTWAHHRVPGQCVRRRTILSSALQGQDHQWKPVSGPSSLTFLLRSSLIRCSHAVLGLPRLHCDSSWHYVRLIYCVLQQKDCAVLSGKLGYCMQGLPLDGTSVLATALYAGVLFLMGLCIAAAAPACNNPIFAEIVPPELRNMVSSHGDSHEHR